MATYSIPGQNLTFNLPDEGTVFRAVGDANGDRVYKVVNGKVTVVASPTAYAATDLRAPDGTLIKAGQPMGQYAGAMAYNQDWRGAKEPNSLLIVDPSYRGPTSTNKSGRESFEATGGKYDSLPEFNMADIQTVLERTGGTLPKTSATQTVDPNNANGAVVTSDGKVVSAPNPAPQPGAITPPADLTTYKNPNAANPVTGAQQPPGTATTAPATSTVPVQTNNTTPTTNNAVVTPAVQANTTSTTGAVTTPTAQPTAATNTNIQSNPDVQKVLAGAASSGNYGRTPNGVVDLTTGQVVMPLTGSTTTAPAGGNQTGTVTTPTNTANNEGLPQITGNLQEGASGPEVAALQNYLISQGISIPSIQNGSAQPGYYGPETKAAVAQWQKSMEAKGLLKVPDPSQYGFFGPLSREALAKSAQAGTGTSTTTGTGTATTTGTSVTTGADAALGTDLQKTIETIRTAYGLKPADPNKTPVQQAIEDYTAVYTSLGIPSIKQSYQDAVKEFSDISNELNDKIAEIRDNPWYSQGIGDAKVNRLQEKYATRLDIATNKMQLFDALTKEGIAQANDILGLLHNTQAATEDAVNKAIELASKKVDAQAKLNTSIVEVGGRKILIDDKTGNTIKDLGPAPSATTPKGTAEERAQETVAKVKQLFQPGYTIPNSNGVPYVDKNGYATPQGWKTALDASGLSREDFIKQFGYLLYIENGKVSASYGLTPAEQKLLGLTP